MYDQIVSWIRTSVAVAVGMLLTWLAEKTGVVIDAETSAWIVSSIQAAVTVVVYVLFRLAETYATKYLPWAKYALVVPSPPKYESLK